MGRPANEELTALVLRFQAGDVGALDVLVRAVMPSMLRAATAILRDPAEAEDATLVALERVLPRLRDFEPPEGFVRYLRRAVRHAAVDALRIRSRGPRPLGLGEPGSPGERRDEAPDPEAATASTERRAQIWRQVEALPEPDRTLVQLHYRDGLPLDQAAERVGVSRSTAKRRLRAARLVLAQRLKAWE